MSKLNLPEEFRKYENIAFQRKKKYVVTSIVFGGQTVREVLTALSDARDELHKKDCIIGDLVKEK